MLLSDKEYSNFLHNVGYSSGNKRFKFFTFGDLEGKYRIEGKNIVFTNGFALQIRSKDTNFINSLIKSACNQKNYILCNQPIILDDFRVESKVITESELCIKTLSPITVHATIDNGKTVYYTPHQKEFYDAVKCNALSKLEKLGYSDRIHFEMIPCCDFTEKNKIVTVYKNTYITAWSGRFRLISDAHALNLLYDVGIGTKNSQGFGMFDVE